MSLRRATPDDAPELTRLRAVMYESWGEDVTGEEWRASATEMFRRRLRDEADRFAAFVMETDGRIVATGVGWITEHLPNPHNHTGLRGHIASMSTEPEHRGRGYARVVVDALLAWFAALGVERVDLIATKMGEPLYRSVGFAEHRALPLTRRPPSHTA